ncbi:hypothetical protein FNV43_RR05797 [Rhamnella rubrinervis]|uniref:Uncharacterized protein n=1 Tax=Rhamnella rubrinervis TaxID=2594499 RepID=A0A8K0MRK1_9ROSA|nr:hypothetical protein FNV43_RR05797 [Rhamnella rubrinervis]
MAASIAGSSTVVRTLLRATTSNSITASTRFSAPPLSSIRSAFRPLRSGISSPSPLRLIRRELSSLRPIHSAIASACLVSKLPADATICTEGLPL